MEVENTKLQIDNEEGITTAETVFFFNDLFDSVNGNNNESDLRSPISDNSAHHSFWTDAKIRLRKMSYVDKITRELISVPTLKNWLFTIDGFQKIWNIVRVKHNFRILKSRYCNQDPIENFFGQIRSHAVRNINPTPQQFQDSFKTLLLSNKSISIIQGNCETADDSYMLLSLEKCLEDNLVNAEVCDVIDNNSDDESHEMISDMIVREEFSLAELSEHINQIILTLTKEHNYCQECNESLKNNEFIIIAKQIVRRVNKLLETRSYHRNILKVLLQHFDDWNINMNWHYCLDHHHSMFKTMVRVISIKCLTWWCNQKNKLIHSASDKLSDVDLIEDMNNIREHRKKYQLQK